MNDHPEELLSRYPDLLDEAELRQVEEHLRQCEPCQALACRIEAVGRAAEELPAVEPSPQLDARVLERIRAEAPPRRSTLWTISAVAVPVALAAAVVLAVVLRPERLGIQPDDPWTVKGPGAIDEGDLSLQVAVVEDGRGIPVAQGDRVEGGAVLLLGGTVPAGRTATVFLVQDGQRQQVWRGAGDETTAEGGMLGTDDGPATVRAPGSGLFELEIWRGEGPSDPASEVAGRIRLVAGTTE